MAGTRRRLDFYCSTYFFAFGCGIASTLNKTDVLTFFYSPASPPPPQQKRYGRSLLDEARAVNEGLRQQILALQEQIARNEDENVSLKNKLDAASERNIHDIRKKIRSCR